MSGGGGGGVEPLMGRLGFIWGICGEQETAECIIFAVIGLDWCRSVDAWGMGSSRGSWCGFRGHEDLTKSGRHTRIFDHICRIGLFIGAFLCCLFLICILQHRLFFAPPFFLWETFSMHLLAVSLASVRSIFWRNSLQSLLQIQLVLHIGVIHAGSSPRTQGTGRLMVGESKGPIIAQVCWNFEC